MSVVAMPSKPNIVYFVCHDLGRALGCYGADMRTPHIDAFAAESVRFADAHCTSQDWHSPRAVQQALSHLDSRDRSRPFYLNIGAQDPHAATWRRVGREIPGLPDDTAPVWLLPGMLRTPALEAAFRRFAAAVAYMDQSFGRLWDGLKTLQHDRDTIVVFTTDHGVSGPRAKGHLYGVGTEIALLIRRPDEAQAGTVRDQLIGNIDFRPTLCEAAGIEPASPVQGRSFWSAMDNAAADHHDAIFLERNYHGEKRQYDDPDYEDLYDPMRAVRTQKHLYIRNFLPDIRPAEPLPADCVSTSGGQDWRQWSEYARDCARRDRPATELYDLVADPLEAVNRSGESECASVEAALAQQLQEWMQATHDFIPDPPPPRPEPPGWGPHWM